MKSWNYRIKERTSWVTGLPTEPDKPCQKCKGEADTWVAHDYTTGMGGRVSTTYMPFCRKHAEDLVALRNNPQENNAMSRQKKTEQMPETAAASKPKRGRKAKGNATEGPEETIVITAEEQALTEKYGHLLIIPGSWRASGGRPEFGHKRTIQVKCKACEAVRTICTSDAQWPTCAYCVTCSADIKRNRKRTKDAKKELK